jgi:hypothetical protein
MGSKRQEREEAEEAEAEEEDRTLYEQNQQGSDRQKSFPGSNG